MPCELRFGEAKGKNWWCVLYPQDVLCGCGVGLFHRGKPCAASEYADEGGIFVVSAMEQKKITPKIKCRLVELWSER